MKLLSLPLVLLCCLVSACAGTLTPREIVHWPEIRGQVLEDGTEKPIAGAMLVARWSGVGAYSHSECFHVEAATSDANGNYVIPAWTNNKDSNRLTYQSVQLTVYAPEYIWVRSDGPFTNEETYNTYKKFTDWIEGAARTVKYLKRDTGSVEDQLDSIRRISGANKCPSSGESEKNLLPLRRVLLEQAMKLSERKSDTDMIEGLLFQVEMLELGYENAEKRQVERIRGAR